MVFLLVLNNLSQPLLIVELELNHDPIVCIVQLLFLCVQLNAVVLILLAEKVKEVILVLVDDG
jgi:hypothetical protein